MAGVVICDRCSRFGKGEALGGLAYRTNISDKTCASTHVELCPKCVEEFFGWLYAPKVQPGPVELSAVPFTEPYRAPDVGDVDQADEPDPLKYGSR